MQAPVERVQVVIALGTDAAERGLELVGRQGAGSQHDLHAVMRDFPAGRLDLARARGLSGSQTGLVLFMCT